jgi:sugar transferase (PEP-CTERM/EpsH1 system associated)
LKILYLVHRTPHPPNRGDRIRSYHYLRFMAARAEVHLAFLAASTPAQDTMAALERLCVRVAAVPVGTRSRWLRAACSVVAGHTATEGLFASSRLRRVVRNWADEVDFDMVVAYCSSMVQYLDAPGLASAPVVVDLVDVDSQKWFDYASHARGLKRWLFALEGRRLRRLERSLADRATVILTSQEESALYRSFCPGASVRAIGNGVDLEYFQPRQACGAEAATCVFVGALDYRANLDGIAWFIEHVWPEVRRRQPAARLRLVGSNPGVAARRLAEEPGVELVGEVPDVRPYLTEAAVSVVPLRVARGIQNKVLESLAMGKAVVASPQSLEGLELEPGVHAQKAGTAEQWIDAVTTLLGDPNQRRRLGQAGRAQVERRYSWPAQLEPFGALLGSAFSQHHVSC